MKKDWETKTVGEVCDLMTGGTPSRSHPEYFKNGNIKWLVSGDIHKKEIFDCGALITEEAYRNSNAKFLPVNSVLIALNGQGKTRGTVALLRMKATCNQSLVSIYPKDLNQLLPEYLFRILDGRYDEIRKMTGDTGNERRGLNMPLIRSIKITVPPLQEQEHIVKILNKKFGAIDELVKITEQQTVDVKELFDSRLNGVYGSPGDDCESKSLEEITTLLGDGLHGTPEYDENGDYFFINGNNLSNGEIIIKGNTKRVSQDEYEKYKKELSDRTVFVSINGTLGNVAFYNNEKVILGKSACYFNLVEVVNKYYIKYFIQSPMFIKYLHTEATGATIKNISLKTMREMIINLPSLTQQTSIVKDLDELSEKTKEMEVIFRRKITDLEELKKSYLHEAFSGNL